MREVPTGTVTFVFTDVEGSTRLLHDLGEKAYAEALAEHRRRLRGAFARAAGVEVDMQGDAFFYAFATAPAALEACRAAQDALAGGPILVRMGVHTGTPLLTADGYVGTDVHRAARIAACGHGGQVLVSAATAALAGVDGLRDLGHHRLKDLSAPERIYQLGHGEFGPLRSLYHTNLPVPSTPFIGRARELADVAELVADPGSRLVTLTGAGGSGKTRLALQAAGAASDDYPGGVWWVPLAPLRHADLVLPAAAQALGAESNLADDIGDQRLLLLFDNFEHVVAAAPGLADVLVACPRLSVLVTSRERLHLGGEQEYPVPPFVRDESIAFFSSRARAVQPDFEANRAVAEICDRLDDLPLALELAAARVKVLTLDGILRRLEQRLPLLTGGARDLPERQRTLRATIDWSYELLTEAERQLLGRLSVFSGGWTLEAAEAITGADLDLLQSLVEKSLVRHSEGRYWLLETIREYAAEQFETTGEATEFRRRHADYVHELVEGAGLLLEPEGEQAFALVREEIANVRAALDWSLEHEPVLGLAFASALDGFWAVTDPSEGMRRLAALLDRATDAPLELRARAYRAYGSSANPAGDDEGAEWAYERSLEAYRAVGDKRGAAAALLRLGYSAFYRGDTVRAGELAAEALALSGEVAYGAVEAQALGLAGEVEYAQGNREAGSELIERSADLAAEVGFSWWRSRMLRKLVDCLAELGREHDAEPRARESLRLMWELGDRQMTVFALARVARVSAALGRLEETGLVWGAIEAEEARARMGAWAKERERLGAPVLVHRGSQFEAGRARGRELALEDAVELALGEPKPAPSA